MGVNLTGSPSRMEHEVIRLDAFLATPRLKSSYAYSFDSSSFG
jgi:hypothetical protein